MFNAEKTLETKTLRVMLQVVVGGMITALFIVLIVILATY